MLVITEFLPNPTGADAAGEWIELWNGGPAAISLSGWRIGVPGGKSVALLPKTLAAGEYLVVPRSATKLSLKNTDGALELRDPAGKVVSTLAFLSDAPEGKSANAGSIGSFFATPTPGAPAAAPAVSFPEPLPPGEIVSSGSTIPVVLTGFAASLALAVLFVFLVQQSHALRELFFGINQKTW